MERIHVSVRARPISPEDTKTSPWKISSDSISMPNNHPFEFDRIFKEDCKTVQVYEARTKEIVAASVRGFNGTVFAYGQTNSGKTHTMRGSPSEPGVVVLALNDLFDIIKKDDASREFSLRMSYLEIYNEEINDLLAPHQHRKLQIHENQEKGIFVAGLREEIVSSPQQVLQMMEFGESQRHIGETNMNFSSSRSHTIFRMIIESRQKTQDKDVVRVSVLNLVDLAGSERAAKTGVAGIRLKEGSHINKSLMTRGTVIKKLSEGVENQGGHVPYRDSKLTRILQPALAGNANIAIICNVTLSQIHADETKSSLEFASRALSVSNCAHVNEILTDAALLKRQKKEIKELRFKLKASSHSYHSEEEILNLRNALLKSDLERERIALELEEEKKAQAQREDVLQEQAKEIKKLSSMEKCEKDHFKKENSNSLVNLVATEVEVLVSEFQKTKVSVETMSSVMDDGLQHFAFFSPLIHDLKLYMRQCFEQHASLISSYQNVQSCLKQKVLDIENEKLLLQKQCVGLQNQLEEQNQKAHKDHETSLMMLSEHHEWDINKQESFACERRESLIVDRSAKQSSQEKFKKLEVLAFKMETTIASLEKTLCRNEGLDSEITALTEKLKQSNTQIEHLQKDVTELNMRIEGSSSNQQLLETQVKQLLEEKEELATRLANSLLEMEEKKAIWNLKENALTDAMEEKIRLYNIQIESLSKEMSEAKKELESSRLERVTLADRLKCYEENAKDSMEKSLEIDSLGDDELERSDGDKTERLRGVEKLGNNEASESKTTEASVSVMDTDNNVAEMAKSKGRQGARKKAPASKEVDEEQVLAPYIIYVYDDEVVEEADQGQRLAPEIIYVDDDDDDDEVVEVVAVSSSPEKSGEVPAKFRTSRANKKPVKYVLRDFL